MAAKSINVFPTEVTRMESIDSVSSSDKSKQEWSLILLCGLRSFALVVRW
jgi:hypothetical protein